MVTSSIRAISPWADRTRRRLIAMLTIVSIALGALAWNAAESDAAQDVIFVNGTVQKWTSDGLYQGSGGAFATFEALTQIDARTLDSNQACWHAYNGGGQGYTYGYCTSSAGNSPYGGSIRKAHCYPTGVNQSVMRCRHSYN